MTWFVKIDRGEESPIKFSRFCWYPVVEILSKFIIVAGYCGFAGAKIPKKWVRAAKEE